MSTFELKDIFTRATAAPLYVAALGASHRAMADGKAELSAGLLDMARKFRHIKRRGVESHSAGTFGVEPVKKGELPDTITALAQELQLTGGWMPGDSTLVGMLLCSDGTTVRRVYAKKHGTQVRFMAEPDVLPKEERAAKKQATKAAAVVKEKARVAKVKATRAASSKTPAEGTGDKAAA
ncbi:hypothetical protein ACWEDZ_39240 [Streptomyces sp. NPDC005047]